MDQPASTDEVHEDFEDCMAAQVLANMEGFDQAHGMYTPTNALFRLDLENRPLLGPDRKNRSFVVP